MRAIFSLISLLFFIQFLAAQSVSKSTCYAEKLLNQKIAENPDFYKQQEEKVQQFIKNSRIKKFNKAGTPIITIPVVIHVVYNPLIPESNVIDKTLKTQIDVLNEDFRRINADTVNIPDIFKTMGSDIEIEFCLATLDPDGNPTTGITRTASYLNYNPQTFNDFVKDTTTGGANAWPAGDYLNMWCCDMSLIVTQYVIGYAQFPGGDPATDGVVIAYPFFGRTNDPSTAPNNLGRTAVHEVGHWLGLRHIWGDGDCTATDFVEDTPRADGAHQSDCAQAANTCSNEDPYWAGVDPPDMVENYMDYSGDNCMNIFTHGQKERMMGFLYTDTLRFSLFNSDKCRLASGITMVAPTISATLFPNPANDKINLMANENIVEIAISQIDGKLSYALKPSQAADAIDPPVADLNKGFYMLTFKGVSGKTGVLRFFKQ